MRYLSLALLLGAGCGVEPGEPRFPIDLLELRYEFFRADAGVSPSQSISRDPNNIFVEFPIGTGDEAFDIAAVGSNTAAYYAWGTLLAEGGNVDPGVAQYFTAVALQEIFSNDEFVDGTNPDDVRQQAIAAYQALLDNYPGTVLDIDGSGSVFIRLATPSYLGIEALGGNVLGNWELITVTDADGNQTQVAVQGGSTPVFPPEFEPAPEEEEGEGS
ncbi:MAG: hypothetical protein AAFX94_06920 [Myxococcota bacterium]